MNILIISIRIFKVTMAANLRDLDETNASEIKIYFCDSFTQIISSSLSSYSYACFYFMLKVSFVLVQFAIPAILYILLIKQNKHLIV